MGRTQQAWRLIRQFGLLHLARLKRRHDRVLPWVRGYVTVEAVWALLYTGVMDELEQGGEKSSAELAGKRGLRREVLTALCEYLDCVGVLKRGPSGGYLLDDLGRVMLAEPRGEIDLMRGYKPVLESLEELLRGEKVYGRDVQRVGKYVAIGSGELGRQLPFRVMTGLIRGHGFGCVLDLGCGDGEFLLELSRQTPVKCYGIDISAEAISHGRQRVESVGGRIELTCADMFRAGDYAPRCADVDCLTACDTFHEYLSGGQDRLQELLRTLGREFPGRAMVVAEFCRQGRDQLRKHPTAFLEHDLFHNLTSQEVLTAHQWHDLFEQAGWRVVQEQVYDIVGHGYWLLRQGE